MVVVFFWGNSLYWNDKINFTCMQLGGGGRLHNQFPDGEDEEEITHQSNTHHNT